MSRLFPVLAVALFSATGLTVGCSQPIDDSSADSSVEQPLGNTPSTPATCTAACNAVDQCGILTQYGISFATCEQVCMGSFTEEDATWAQSASCAELEDAIADGGAPDACRDVCSKLGDCGILAAASMSDATCRNQCAGYDAGLVTWANDPATTCDELASALGVTVESSCEKACDRIEACGLFENTELDPTSCPAYCKANFTEAQASQALTATCAQLASALF